MIAEHQPTIFGEGVIAGVSSLKDGNMSFRVAGSEDSDETIRQNRRRFLEKLGLDINKAKLVYLVLNDTDDYCRYIDASEMPPGAGMIEPGSAPIADAVVTTKLDEALFLPLADCGGVMLHDPKKEVLMLSHLGRHSTVQEGAKHSVEHLVNNYGVNPADLKIYNSPGISGKSYKLKYFDPADDPESAWKEGEHFRRTNDGIYVDLQQYNYDRFIESGVPEGNIQWKQVDTYEDKRYPSHFKQPGMRFAVVAVMKAVKMQADTALAA
jgi:copper oxidase (laccase) domain-containing protein